MKASMVILIALLLCGCTEPAIREGEGTYTDSGKEVTTAKIKMQDGQLKEVELDQTSGDTTKKNLQENYHMKAASAIGKEWNEQVQFFEQYVQNNGIDKIEIDDEGKAVNEDIKTGCTIRIDGFLYAIDDAKQNIESQK